MNHMPWTGWVAVVLIVLGAGWMLFDGTRALVVGDYVTPKTGNYAGQLGPWAGLVKAIGIEPRSMLMKSIFVVYGFAALAIAVCFIIGLPWARTALIAICVLGLWYLPVGTVTNLIVLVFLLLTRRSSCLLDRVIPCPISSAMH